MWEYWARSSDKALVVSADAVVASPMPAPSTSIPEATAIAVFIEAGTLLLPVIVTVGCRIG